MSENQLHGKVFEEKILESIGFCEVTPKDAIFDIPLIVTSKNAGSIKLTASGINKEIFDATLGLSDAGRIWAWRDLINIQAPGNDLPPSIRMIVGIFEQEDTYKLVNTIFDINLMLCPTTIAGLYGELSLNEIYAFHLGMRREFFPDHQDARKWAKLTNEEFSKRGGLIKLNPKIDSGTQRRLQCSVRLADLLSIADSATMSAREFMGLKLPFRIESSARKRNKKDRGASLP